jgi:hypothetical protein
MAEQTATRTVYVVLRVSWWYDDNFTHGSDAPLKAFADPDQAEAYRAACEERERVLQQDWEYYQGGASDSFVVVETEVEG